MIKQNFHGFFKKIGIATFAASLSISAANAAPSGTYADKYAAIVVDANSGKTLYQVNANARRYPASLTKMMTLYLLFEAMEQGRVNAKTPIPVSRYAASRPPTKIGFRPGQTIPVEEAAKALITKSANDVASAIAEYLGGSEPRFGQIMTAKARRLGMMNTNFANASGLPDTRNYSTARDMAILSLALREHFPTQYRWFTTTSFQFRGQTINGHNNLVKTVKGVDGIKTGYVNMSGFNLATSIRLDNKSLVGVVMGGRTARLRDAHMIELLRRYLPQATTRKTRGPLLAANSAPNNAADLPSGQEAPIPVARANVSQREKDAAILTALAAQSAKSNAAVAVNNAVVTQTRPAAIDPVITASAPTNARPAPTGWAIQIGSLPSQDQANDMLSKANGSAKSTLSRVTAYTQIFEKGGQRYYRARFVGFNSKQSAWDACSVLKKANFNCYAISQ